MLDAGGIGMTEPRAKSREQRAKSRESKASDTRHTLRQNQSRTVRNLQYVLLHSAISNFSSSSFTRGIYFEFRILACHELLD